MYYLIEWYSYFIIYDDVNKHLAYSARPSVEEAVVSFKAASWDINTQPDRNFHVTPTHLVEKDFQYKILGKFKSLDDIQTTNPEFFI